jgi:probable F420-dependent oxidoreductase
VPMKVGTYLPNFAYDHDDGIDHAERLRNWIVRSEELGFDSIWVTDHLLRARDMYARTWLEPLTSLAFAASITKKVLLGPGVLLLPLRDPVILAKMAVTLQALCSGRFVLAIGTGWYPPEFEATGTTREDRGARTDEVLDLVKRLAGGEIVSHDGRFFHLKEVHIEPSPVPMPVWVGGGSQLAHAGSVEKPRLHPAVARRIARADGWFVRPTAEPHQILDDWQKLQPYIAEAGRTPDEIEIGHGQLMYLTEEDRHDRAVELQHQAAEKILGTSRSREQLESSYLFGTIDEIVDNCRRRAAIGVEHLILHPFTDDPDQLELWGSELLPRLKSLEVARAA